VETRNFSGTGSEVEETAGYRFVEVLAGDKGKNKVGYRLSGGKPGPTVLVAGFGSVAGPVYSRLLDLPTLPWMRGTLILIDLGALDDLNPNHPLLQSFGVIDRMVHLPFAAATTENDDLQQQGYWMVLKICTEMGMISGRGVSI
jgi:hypothetical protein